MRGDNAATIVADVEQRVSDGVLVPGDRLPPVRTLADELGLAPNTVAAAYRRLGERGFVVGRGRSGTFIAPRPPMVASEEPEIPPGVLDLARGNPDPALLPVIRPVVGDEPVLYGHELFDPDLRASAAASLAADGVSPDHVSVVAGALDGIERILDAHLRPGDRVAIEDPAFYAVIDLLSALGLMAVPVPIDDEGMTLVGLESALDRDVKALVHTPRGQNPFGATLSRERQTTLAPLIGAAPDLIVVEDDYAAEVAGAPYLTLTDSSRRSWAVVRSGAKAYGPDLRIAWMAADESTVRRVEGRQRLGPGWVSHILQRTVASMMADSGVGEVLQRATDTYRDRRRALLDALAQRGIEAHGTAGLNVWVPVPDESSAVASLRARGLAVRPGERFRLQSAPGVRVTTAALAVGEAERVAEEMAAVLGSRPASARTA